jgi:hypothetical protein
LIYGSAVVLPFFGALPIAIEISPRSTSGYSY